MSNGELFRHVKKERKKEIAAMEKRQSNENLKRAKLTVVKKKKTTNYQGVCVCVVVLLNGSAVVVRVQHRQCCAVRAATLCVQFHTFTVLLQITTVINGISTRWTGHLSSENNVNT